MKAVEPPGECGEPWMPVSGSNLVADAGTSARVLPGEMWSRAPATCVARMMHVATAWRLSGRASPAMSFLAGQGATFCSPDRLVKLVEGATPRLLGLVPQLSVRRATARAQRPVLWWWGLQLVLWVRAPHAQRERSFRRPVPSHQLGALPLVAPLTSPQKARPAARAPPRPRHSPQHLDQRHPTSSPLAPLCAPPLPEHHIGPEHPHPPRGDAHTPHLRDG